MNATPTRTAIGLLCRIYTGWDGRRPALLRGAEALTKVGPSEQDMYYNYYATLVLHHLGGPDWDTWNKKIREYLIRTQAKTGHETGSWTFTGGQGSRNGGRHFNTCLACLILETYYRSKPMYQSAGRTDLTPEDVGIKPVKPTTGPSGERKR
jgi:hypothetical protein